MIDLDSMSEDDKLAALESIHKSIAESKEVQKQKIAANVNLVLQALKKMESDIRARYDETGKAIEKRVANIKDGKDGRNGVDGKAGRDGRSGADGATGPRGADGLNGRDGRDGEDGVSVTDAHIDFDGSLIIHLSTGRVINVGEVVAPDLVERIKVITNGGGTSQQVLDTLVSLQNQINAITNGVTYQGTWNASTNTPTLTSSAGTTNGFYIVSVAGSTTLNGTSNWGVGDWAIFNGSIWQRVEGGSSGNFVDLSASGTVTLSGLTASTALALDASKNIVSVTNTGTGNNVLATSPTLVTPVLGTPTSGDFSTGTFTWPTFNQNTTGTASNVTGTVAIANGGTGETTRQAAMDALAGAVTSGSYLRGNGTDVVMNTIQAADVPTLNQNTTGTASNVTGTVAIANGGTGATTAASALSNLGAVAKAGDTMTGALGFVAGSASTPSLFASGDTNTGIFFPAADTIAFAEGGAEAARIDSAGNLGIGTSSPSARFDVRRGDADGLIAEFHQSGGYGIDVGSSQSVAYLSSGYLQAFTFKTDSGSGQVERARIDSSGNLGIGTTSPDYKLDVERSGDGNVLSANNGTRGVDLAVTSSGGSIQTYNTNQNLGLTVYGTGVLTFATSNAERARITSGGDMEFKNSGGTSVSFIGVSSTAAQFGNRQNDAMIFYTNNTERARIDSSGNFGIGTTSPSYPISIERASQSTLEIKSTSTTGESRIYFSDTTAGIGAIEYQHNGDFMRFYTNNAERARIDSSGRLLVGTTSLNFGAKGAALYQTGLIEATVDANICMNINRLTDDGTLFGFYQASTLEGSISVSGTTVSYNGGHLSRYAQTTTAKDDSIVKGTVLSNLDEMNVYTKDGQPVDNEQLNKVKVSDTEGDVNVAGVFVNWSHDEDHNVDEINMAMTGDMIIRIAQGTTVQRGDLLMSAGDGTAKPQGDDIVRSKTVAKVTSNHITCTYADGSYCVPCVLMAC